MPVINCEVYLILTCSRKCVLTDMITHVAVPAQINAPEIPAIAARTNATFTITDCKLYVPVVALSAENDNKRLEQLKTGFKRTITWNKYRSEMSNQTNNNNLNYLIDLTFTKVDRLFVLLFERQDDRNHFSNYYVPKVEINFIGRLEEDHTTMLFIIEKKEETTFDFSQSSVTVIL